ncbi:C6 finger domain protein [Aspergillus sclerotialis]|uniref:C6 finger domain protein n=1 Tax=Aspergillus sclerotialis TaxID=2070753 RepID=A0A3A2ZZF1_9EURO|nr:C6 finger domain protein [Aspergillus sclerotialis]
MQNVMFLGTLLNVVADTWLRVSQTNAEELGRQAAPAPYVASLMQSSNPLERWRIWLRQTVRSAVIGGPIDEPGRCQCSDSPDLLSLIKEMEERQRKWHSNETSHPLYQSQQPQSANGQSPTRGSFGVNGSPNHLDDADTQGDACNEKDLLCLRVIGSARNVISKFNFEPYEYPDGMVS